MFSGSKAARSSSLGVCVVLLVAAVLSACTASAKPRPISDFVNAQGLPSPYSPIDYIGWFSATAKPPIYDGIVDYAGVGNRWLINNGHASLGTTFAGSVNERPLADGRAEVLVNLITNNALTWVYSAGDALDFPDEFNCTTCAKLFGHSEPEVLAGAQPSLGSSRLSVRMIIPAPGAPLPDIFDAFVLGNAGPDLQLLSLSFVSSAMGTLADGSPGMASVFQTGLFMTGFRGAVGDGFPDERVEVKAIGAMQVLSSSPTGDELAIPAPAPQRSTWARLKQLYR